MRIFISLFLFTIYLCSCDQKKTEKILNLSEVEKVTETKLIEYFKYDFPDKNISRDSLFYTDFEDMNFVLSIHDTLLPFEYDQKTLNKPYFNQYFADSEVEKTRVKNFPKSYSVIYFNHLISLFENGKFACFNLINFERNQDFEKKINTQKFDYHWIINGTLTAQSGNSFYVWEDSKWTKLKKNYPFKNRPILYADGDYIVFNDCHGEWGGTVYFYEILTEQTYFTEATCSNTIWKTKEGYHVLSNLRHGDGSTDLKVISLPIQLSKLAPQHIGLTVQGEAMGYTDKSNHALKKLDLYGGMIYSRINYKNQDIYLAEEKDLIFLCKIKDHNLQIVHPFFNLDFHAHDQITRNYGDFTLMNITLWGKGLEREISNLIIQENKILRLDWNEMH
jgi:hypothetical protein